MLVKIIVFFAVASMAYKLALGQKKATQYCSGIFLLASRVQIVGGIHTREGEFPHMVALGYGENKDTKWLCGGSLISSQFVLTAAHCTQSYMGVVKKVRLGTRNLQNPTTGYLDVSVKRIINHPGFKPPSHYNDIALLELSKAVHFSQGIKPACLHLTSSISSQRLNAIGWGRTDFAGPTSDDLLKVTLQKVDRGTCNKFFKSIGQDKLKKGIDNKLQLCAGGGQNDVKDTCQGDSGGPLGYKNGLHHYVAGITSFGKACGLANIPAVYTRVSAFVPWIESVVWR